MRTSKLRCGCEYALGERERWVRLCPAHQAEWDETHGRWAAEQGAGLEPPGESGEVGLEQGSADLFQVAGLCEKGRKGR